MLERKSVIRLITILAILVTITTACQNLDIGQMTQVIPESYNPDEIPTSTVPTGAEPSNTQAAPDISESAPPLESLSTATPTTTIPPNPYPSELYPHYIITATLDYAWRYLEVQQEIIIPNPTSENLAELVLVIQPNWHPNAFRLTSLAWMDGSPIQTYKLDGIRLRILLLEPFEPGDSIHLSLAYEVDIPPLMESEDFGPNPFGYTSRQINLTDWYPFVPPYIDGVGWQVHNPWYYGEHLVYPSANFDVSLQLTNTPDGTQIAASGLDLGDGNLHRYHLEGARNFVFSISPEYRLFQEQVGDTTVLGYAFPFDVVPGEAAFRTTVQALELYTQLFGPYPYQGMTMVQADFEHGMEYSGFYFLSKAFYNLYNGTASTFLVAIAAHETAHQWWYGMVGNDQALEPWLDEALCTYSEKLFYQNLYPQSLDWWQEYRVDFNQPTGWVDTSIYNSPGYQSYRDAVYLNGATFLDELRNLVGEEAFFAFLKDYLALNNGQIATSNDFFNTLQTHSDADWDALKTRFFKE